MKSQLINASVLTLILVLCFGAGLEMYWRSRGYYAWQDAGTG